MTKESEDVFHNTPKMGFHKKLPSWQKNPKTVFHNTRNPERLFFCNIGTWIRKDNFSQFDHINTSYIFAKSNGKREANTAVTFEKLPPCRSKNVAGQSILVWFIQTFHQLVFTRSRYRVAWIWLGLIRPKHRQSSNGERARSEATKGERLQRETAQRVHECVAHAWVKLTNFCTTSTSSTMRHSLFFGTQFSRGLYTAVDMPPKSQKPLHYTKLDYTKLNHTQLCQPTPRERVWLFEAASRNPLTSTCIHILGSCCCVHVCCPCCPTRFRPLDRDTQGAELN